MVEFERSLVDMLRNKIVYMGRKRIGFCLVAFFGLQILFFASFATAAEEKAFIRFATAELAPYGFRDGAQSQGYWYDLANQLASEAKLDHSNVLLPFARLFRSMDQKETDCTFLAGTENTRKHFRLIESTGSSLTGGVLARKGIILDDYEDLIGLRIGISLGIKIVPKFDNDQRLTKVSVTNYQHATAMLSRGRIDATAGAIESLLYNMRKLGGDGAAQIGSAFALSSFPIYLSCRKTWHNAAVEKELKEALIRMRDTGQITKIVESYTDGHLKP